MTVTVEMPPELEQRLRDRASRKGQSLEECLLQVLDESLPPLPPSARLTPEEWIAEWRAWVAGHAHWPTDVDDSRESIYEGRGE